MIAVVDAHHHIWRRTDLPWLLGPTQPRIFGPYDALKRDYPIEEFLADVAGTPVTRSIYVQANWAPNWFADEAAWVCAQSARTGWPHAIVAFASMTQEDARRDLDRLAAFPLVRGVRHQMHHHANPLYRFATGPDVVGSPAVIANVARLADYGFAFELQVFVHQTEAALRLVDACPAVTFVLQHAAMPEDLSDEGCVLWTDALACLAARPNVACKLSAFGTFLRRNDPQHVAWAVREAVVAFGAARCLYGSNFPIEKIWTDYASLFAAFEAATADLPAADRAEIFAGTARRLYRLG